MIVLVVLVREAYLDRRFDGLAHALIVAGMLTESSDEDMLDWRGLRECQENEIALGHSLTAAEHALAREAVTLGLTFERAGIAFDPLTFITLRIVEGSSNEYVDPVACLDVLVEFGFLERTVALAVDLLEDAA